MTTLRVALFGLLAFGCASGGPTFDSGVDSGPGRVDGDVRDAGAVTCPMGQHACGAGCISDLENIPENGCRFGCGTACPAPPDGVAGCSAAGDCVMGCDPPFTLMGGMCVCGTRTTCEALGAMCGAPDDGCGTPLDCGSCGGTGVCTAGACSCMLDAEEPNDTQAEVDSRAVFGFLVDGDDTDLTYNELNVHSMTDVDWYRFDVEDTTDGGAPRCLAWLDNIPSDADYDLSAFWVCDDGTNGTTCDAGSPDNELGVGCTSSSAGAAMEHVDLDTYCGNFFGGDPGTLYVRVTPVSTSTMCSAYSLRVRAQ